MSKEKRPCGGGARGRPRLSAGAFLLASLACGGGDAAKTDTLGTRPAIAPAIVAPSASGSTLSNNTGAREFDLEWDSVDIDGVAKDPRWRHAGPPPKEICDRFPLSKDGKSFTIGKSDCVSDPNMLTGESGKMLHAVVCSFADVPVDSWLGHVIWPVDARVAGTLTWNHYSDPPVDSDLTFELLPSATAAALLEENNGTYHVEFDGEETTRFMEKGWWGGLAKALYAHEDSLRKYQNYTNWQYYISRSDKARQKAVAGLVRSSYGVVYARVGIDVQHGMKTELHPVYGFAIVTNTKKDTSTGTVRERWAILLRNWATEGYCAKGFHTPLGMAPDTAQIVIPWLTGAEGVSVDSVALRARGGAGSSLVTSSKVGAGLLLSYAMRPSTKQQEVKKRSLLYGELVTTWKVPKASIGQARRVTATKGLSAFSSGASESRKRWSFFTPRERLRRLLEAADSGRRLRADTSSFLPIERFESGAGARVRPALRPAVPNEDESVRRRGLEEVEKLCTERARTSTGGVAAICAAPAERRESVADSVARLRRRPPS